MQAIPASEQLEIRFKDGDLKVPMTISILNNIGQVLREVEFHQQHLTLDIRAHT
jgi:hypothetical protein